jgi:GTP pyrophosphokinase
VTTRQIALEVAEIVRTLDADDDVVIAALLQPLLDGKYLDREATEKRFGEEPVRLARALRSWAISACPRIGPPSAAWSPVRPRRCARCCWPSSATCVWWWCGWPSSCRKCAPPNPWSHEQRKLAVETREVYAPLANRLGVWQIKWEMEDLAFRYLQPDEYKHIAAALKTAAAPSANSTSTS